MSTKRPPANDPRWPWCQVCGQPKLDRDRKTCGRRRCVTEIMRRRRKR